MSVSHISLFIYLRCLLLPRLCACVPGAFLAVTSMPACRLMDCELGIWIETLLVTPPPAGDTAHLLLLLQPVLILGLHGALPPPLLIIPAGICVTSILELSMNFCEVNNARKRS